MMKYYFNLFLPLLAVTTVQGFVATTTPVVVVPATTSTSSTELNALGLRTAKRFISRRILRRKSKDGMEVVMKNDEDAAVVDGAPIVATSQGSTNESSNDSKGPPEQQLEAKAVVVPDQSSSSQPLTIEAEQSILESASANAGLTITEAVDEFFAGGNPEDAKELILKEFAKGVDANKSGPLFWRLVKAQYELFCVTDDPKLQQEYLEKGLALLEEDVCDTIVEADETDTTQAMLLKWNAILLGKLGSFQSTKEKMSNSFTIKEKLEQAQALLAQQNQEDSSIYQALGEWCFKVANISFLERQAASVLFGKPPQSSYEEALDYFQKGYQLKATSALATKIADTYQKMGQGAEADQWSAKSKKKVGGA